MFVSQEVARRTVTNTQVEVEDVDDEEEKVVQTVHLTHNFFFFFLYLFGKTFCLAQCKGAGLLLQLD